MPKQPRKRGGVTEVVVGLNFHPRAWVPDNLRESTNVVVRCLLSMSAEHPAKMVVDAAYPQVRLPQGLAEAADNSTVRRVFRSALLEALRNRLEAEVRPIPNGVVDWSGGMLSEEVVNNED